MKYYEKSRIEYEKSLKLRSLTFDIENDDDRKKIRKLQDEAFKKTTFFKNLSEASKKIKES